MSTGENTWLSGAIAGRVLESRLRESKRSARAFRVAMPDRVAVVLRRCFESDPADRWASMGEAADALTAIYRRTTGQRYRRKRPRVSPTSLAALPL